LNKDSDNNLQHNLILCFFLCKDIQGKLNSQYRTCGLGPTHGIFLMKHIFVKVDPYFYVLYLDIITTTGMTKLPCVTGEGYYSSMIDIVEQYIFGNVHS